MAELLATLKALGGNRLKVWLAKEENRSALKKASMGEKAYAMEKWAQTYEGAPFPIELFDDQTQAAVDDGDSPPPPEAQAAAPPPDVSKPPPDHKGKPGLRDPEEPLFGRGRQTPAVLLTEQQRFIANMVASAARTAPVIENVVELKTMLQMLVPLEIKQSRPEYTYKWTSVDNLQNDLFKYGGIWEIVTRSNHPHLAEHFFGDEGAVSYKGQSVLTFTRRSITTQLDQETVRQFNFKADAALQKLDKGYGSVRGKEAIRLTISDQQPQEREIGAKDLTISENGGADYYDYGDTGTPNL